MTDAHPLSPERIAAWADGLLPPEERPGVERHLDECADCYELAAGALHFRAAAEDAVPARVVPFRRGRPAAIAALAAALLTATALPFVLRARASAPMRALVRAVGTERPAEARLTGGFAWGPVPRVTRGGGPERSWQVLAAAGRIRERAERSPSPEALRSLGIAHVVLGEWSAAVEHLEEASLAAPRDARILSDLSAVRLERARRENRAEDLPKALDAAEQSLRSGKRLPEALFNRALALDALHLRPSAREAWAEYLEADPASAWSQEVRRRLAERPAGQPRGELWERARRELLEAARRGDDAGVERIVASFALETRTLLETELLVGDATPPDTGPQRVVSMIARAHSRVTGDPLASDSARRSAEIATRGPATARATLARGLRALRDGRALCDTFQYERATPLLAEGAVALTDVGHPLAGWARFLTALRLYRSGRLEESRDLLARLEGEAATRGYRALSGRTDWLLGLAFATRSRFFDSLAAYDRALAAFDALREPENVAALHALIADDYDFLGDEHRGWTHRCLALAGVEGAVTPGRRQMILTTSGQTLVRAGLFAAAVPVEDLVVSVARSRGAPAAAAEALANRAAVHQALGEGDESRRDLAAARREIRAEKDRDTEARISAEIGEREGEALAGVDAAAADRSLSGSIDYFRSHRFAARLPALLLARGRLRAAQGRAAEAEVDYLAGIELLETERDLRLDETLRISRLDTVFDLFHEAIRFEALRRRRPEAAITLAERYRARALLEARGSAPSEAFRGLDALRASLPPDAVTLAFTLLEDRVLVFTLTSAGLAMDESPVPGGALVRDVRRYRSLLRRGEFGADAAELSASLYDLLLRRACARAPRGATLILVPDGVLHLLPFTSLRDAATGRYLVEEHPTWIAPSLALAARGLRAPDISRHPAALVVSSSGPAGALPALAAAEAEAREVAALYPGSLLLLGPAATKGRFIEGAAAHEVVHFAGHAIALEDASSPSRLVLAEEPGATDGGSLVAEEIARAPLGGTRVAVLAACDTAVGPRHASEGVLNLVRPFLAAGVSSVVAALWDVDDQAGRPLLVALHERLARGVRPARALHEAQVESLHASDPLRSSPATWSVFALYGAP